MRADVIVLGAGPGGAVAAARLAALGARVALVDGSHPREKACGGGITRRALELVGGAAAFAGVDAVIVRRARFLDAGAQREAVVPLDDGARLAVVSRRAFDGALYARAQDAGAQALTTRALDLRRADGQWELLTADRRTLRAPWIIGADGANGLLRRRVAQPFSRAQLSIATGYFAHGVTSDDIVIEMTADPPGYIWSFPRPDHLAIGICAQADAGVTVRGLRDQLDRWLARSGIARGARLEPYSWPIPSLRAGDFTSVPVAGPGWLTVGDAAGLVDPITREGIFFALQSALWAAEAVATTRDAAWRPYQDRVREGIGHDLACAARYKAGFFQPRFTRLLLAGLAGSPRVRAIMADLIAGTQPYRSLKWRLLATLEWRLAWNVVTAPRVAQRAT